MTRAQLLELSAGVVLLGGAIGAAAYWGRGAPAPRPDAFPVSRPAEPIEAPDLELSDLAGQTVRLRDLRGQVVLLNFWATWCGRAARRCRRSRRSHGSLAPAGSPSWA